MKHIGTKIINAQPMTREAVESLLNRSIGGDKQGDGYLVTYEDGYQSWSPKDVFDRSYRPTTAMTFGDALVILKSGMRVCRTGWNGKGMWLIKIQGCNDIASLHGYGFGEYLGEPKFSDAVYMKTTDNMLVPWLCSQTDMLAEDWQVVE